MSIGGFFRNIGRKVSGGLRKFGRKVQTFGKGVGRGMGRVFSGAGNAIKKGVDFVEKIPVIGNVLQATPLGRGLKFLGTGLRTSGKLVRGDLKGALNESKDGLKRIALGKLGKFGKVGKLAKMALKNV